MRLIGRWIQDLEDNDYPPPQELVGEWESSQKIGVVKYLSSSKKPKDGRPLSRFLEYFHRCLFGCGAVLGSSRSFDSEWVWNSGLSHYVEDHNVILPAEFVQHAIQGTDKPVFSDHCGNLDYSFWIEWCRTNRSHAYEARISRARVEAESLHMEERYRRLKATEDSIGVSTVTCMYSGCDGKALRGRAFCASCDEKQATFNYRADAFSRKFQDLFKIRHPLDTRK